MAVSLIKIDVKVESSLLKRKVWFDGNNWAYQFPPAQRKCTPVVCSIERIKGWKFRRANEVNRVVTSDWSTARV